MAKRVLTKQTAMVRDGWVSRMLDPEWRQGKGLLCTRRFDPVTEKTVIETCPLGALMETLEGMLLIRPGFWIGNVKHWSADYTVGGESGLLTRQAAKMAGYVDKEGRPQVSPGFRLSAELAEELSTPLRMLKRGHRYALSYLSDYTTIRPEQIRELILNAA